MVSSAEGLGIAVFMFIIGTLMVITYLYIRRNQISGKFQGIPSLAGAVLFMIVVFGFSILGWFVGRWIVAWLLGL